MQVEVRGRRARRWVAGGLIAFGALFSGIGLVLAGVSVSYLTDGERAPGTVVALEWEEHGGGSRKGRTGDEPVAHPVVAFTPAGGSPTRFREFTGSNPPAYEVGERVEVLYRPDSPEDARIDGFAALWLLPLIFGGIGLVIVGVGTGIALVARRRP
ncbi:DUF3592 domain-containing protein [Streptomyces sp. NPDC053493]|uniref:DUF3592 domain-containing protein n=1 Tax=Streptomyces sp. NPDC053493 TaxID=3365705 RepID=UPI0037D97AF5